jgi:hypothetical protein
MVKRDSVCSQPSRSQIELGLMDKVPYRALAGQFSAAAPPPPTDQGGHIGPPLQQIYPGGRPGGTGHRGAAQGGASGRDV